MESERNRIQEFRNIKIARKTGKVGRERKGSNFKFHL